jgi:hypothetical protein
VSLNNEKICCEISEDKIAVCEKTARVRSGNFSDFNSACSKVLVSVKIFQFQDMGNESERYRDAANGLVCPLIDHGSRPMKSHEFLRLTYTEKVPSCKESGINWESSIPNSDESPVPRSSHVCCLVTCYSVNICDEFNNNNNHSIA